jgi:hypothetical protein
MLDQHLFKNIKPHLFGKTKPNIYFEKVESNRTIFFLNSIDRRLRRVGGQHGRCRQWWDYTRLPPYCFICRPGSQWKHLKFVLFYLSPWFTVEAFKILDAGSSEEECIINFTPSLCLDCSKVFISQHQRQGVKV